MVAFVLSHSNCNVICIFIESILPHSNCGMKKCTQYRIHSLTIGPANSFSCFISGSVNIPLNVEKTAVDNTVNHRNACMTMRERSKRRQVRSYDIYSLESRSASGGTVTVYIDTWFVVECVPLSSIPQLLWTPATSRLNLHDQASIQLQKSKTHGLQKPLMFFWSMTHQGTHVPEIGGINMQCRGT